MTPLVIALAAAVVTLTPGARPARIVRVIDGDTVVVAGANLAPTKIRLLGIDCPETHANEKCLRDERDGRGSCRDQLPLGALAKTRAVQLLERRSVYLEPKYPGRDFELDPYNRVLAYIRLDDGRDFGLVLVTDGLAKTSAGSIRTLDQPSTCAHSNKQVADNLGATEPKPLGHQPRVNHHRGDRVRRGR
jgi:endonuclease YncB( thermonuclease family)